MGVDGSVSSCAGQVLVLAIRDVKVSLGVSVLFGKSEIDNIDLISSLANAHEEIVGLDVSVDKVSRVDILDSRDLQGVRSISSNSTNGSLRVLARTS